MDAETKTLAGIVVEPGVMIAKRYEVCERLGAGGVGMVYRAIDHELDGEVVALKLLLPHLSQDENVFRRFRNEVLVARALSHPNIVRTHDMGRAEGGYSYISMEYVNGESLKDKLVQRAGDGRLHPSLAFDEALAVLYQIICGVSYAHGKGVIHRDLKPANVLISKAGEVKLADFGTARIMGMDTTLTQTGQVIGTPDYMSPEQIRGELLDPSCDIYALGIMAYELVTGERPFTADSAVAVAFRHLNDPIPSFASKERGIPQWFEDVVMKACAKKKADRFASVMELAATLLDYAPQLNVQSTFFMVDRTARISATGTVTEKSPPPKAAAGEGKSASIGIKPGALQGENNRADLRFELGSTEPHVEEGGWKLGGSSSTERAEVISPKSVKQSSQESSLFAKALGFSVGILAGGSLLLIGFVRFHPQSQEIVRPRIEELRVNHPGVGDFFGALLGIPASEKVKPTKVSREEKDEEAERLAKELSEGSGGEKEVSPVSTSVRSVTEQKSTPEKSGDVKSSGETQKENKTANSTQKGEGASEEKSEVDSTKRLADVPTPATTTQDSATPAIKVDEQKRVVPAVENEKQPTPAPTEQIKEEVKQEPIRLAGELTLKEGTRAITDESLSSERFSVVRWGVTLTSTSGSLSSMTQEQIRSEISLNIFDLRKSAVVAKLKPEQIQLPTKLEPGIRISGGLSSMKNLSLGAGSYRLDLVRSGELISSKDLVLYRTSVTPAKDEIVPGGSKISIVGGATVVGGVPEATTTPTPFQTPVAVSRVPSEESGTLLNPPSSGNSSVTVLNKGSSGLPVAKGHEQDVPSSAFMNVTPAPTSPPIGTIVANPGEGSGAAVASSESYGGFFKIPVSDASGGSGGTEEKRAMILNLQIQGTEISGSASIAGYDQFTVTGHILTRGMEMELKNEGYYIRLTSGPRGRNIRGLFSFPALGKKGAWEVSRSN